MSSAEAEELVAGARDEGIHLMAVPTPFLVGRVNCYLIDDDPLTLVDTGPNAGSPWTSSSGRWPSSGTASRTWG